MGAVSKRRLFLCLYIGFLAILLEGVSYLIVVGVFDNDLGSRAERHLYSPIRGHQLNPEYRRRSDTDNVLIHSDQGFRRDELVSRNKPNDTVRIIVLGGSTLYGIGTGDGSAYPPHRSLFNNETIPHFLEVDLNDRFSNNFDSLEIEVINAGVTAYHTFQHVLYIFEELFEYDPDIVLFVDGHNDYYNVGKRNPITDYGYSSFAIVDALNARRPFTAIYLGMRHLGAHSYFFRLIEKAAQSLSKKYETRPYNINGDPAALQRDFERELETTAKIGFLRNYKLVEALAEYHDFSFHVFLQPEVVFEDPAVLSNHDQLIAETTRRLYPEGREQIMIETRKYLAGLFASNGIPFTDIGEIAGPSEKGEALYVDYTHLTPHGSSLVAERMLPVVEAMVGEQIERRTTKAVSPAR